MPTLRDTITRYTGLRGSPRQPDMQRRVLSDVSYLYGSATGTTSITAHNGLGISTVYACVDTISKTIASLPSVVMHMDADGDKLPDTTHPQYRLWSMSPYEHVTAYEAKRTLLVDYLIYGNGYMLEIHDPVTFRPLAYKNIRPWDVVPFRDGAHRLWYRVYDPLHGGTYAADQIIHLRDIGYLQDIGMSKIELHATTIGKESAAARFINAMYTNGFFLGGVIEYPRESGDLTDAQIDMLRNHFKTYYGGIDKGAGVAVITGGGQLKQFKNEMPLSNAQYVESAKLNANEICRIYSVPGPKVGLTEGTPYNSLESLNVDYWQNCILPIVTMMEQQINMKCFLPNENCYITHNFDSILRADMSAQTNFFAQMYRMGVLSRNEIRQRMDLNRIPGGDEYYIEGNNMVSANSINHIEEE